jgi:hypothetical protein
MRLPPSFLSSEDVNSVGATGAIGRVWRIGLVNVSSGLGPENINLH